MARRKLKKREQQTLAAETMATREHLLLRRQIATLKRLPHDFRDITAGTRDWEAFATITGRRKEMEVWDNGPILFFGELNEHEKMVLGSQNLLLHWQADPFSTENWIAIIQHAAYTNCSWIYLPDEESKVVDALNTLFSRFGYNVRAKKRLMSEHTGKPIGVVY